MNSIEKGDLKIYLNISAPERLSEEQDNAIDKLKYKVHNAIDNYGKKSNVFS